jgi:hypothetical protein
MMDPMTKRAGIVFHSSVGRPSDGLGTLAVLLLAALAGCAAESPPARNLILISIDTLRQDRLGVYGYGRPTSPELDRFAASGLVFLNAVSVTSWTTPAHMSMLSGRVPSSHGVIDTRTKARGDMPLLSEILRDAGFRTRAWAGSEMVGSRFGFDRGFETYDVKPNRTLAAALQGGWRLAGDPEAQGALLRVRP